MTVGLIDIKSGNLKSLISAIDKTNIKYKICQGPNDFIGVTKIILPGSKQCSRNDQTTPQLVSTGKSGSNFTL